MVIQQKESEGKSQRELDKIFGVSKTQIQNTDPLLPKEQAGFRHGKSTVDQVVLLTQNIEDSFEAKKKAGAVFIDLTAAYDTVWHCGLTCKLLRLLRISTWSK